MSHCITQISHSLNVHIAVRFRIHIRDIYTIKLILYYCYGLMIVSNVMCMHFTRTHANS